MAQDGRQLVFTDGSSNKFWNIELDGASHTVNFGRIGTAGQAQTKEFASDDAAKKSYDKLVAAKLKKGYVDGGGGGSGSTTNKAAAKVPASKAAGTQQKPARQAKAADSPASDAATVAQASSAAPQVDVDVAVDRNVTHQIDLDPVDWFRARYRPRQPLKRGQPAAFDKDDCLKRLAKLKTTSHGWNVRWSDLNLPAALSAEEAHFWLVATTKTRSRTTTMKGFAASLAKEEVDGKLDFAALRKLLEKADQGIDEETTLALANLISVDDYVELMLTKPSKKTQQWRESGLLKTMVVGFNKYFLPYLTDPQLESIRKRLRKTWDPTQEPASEYESFPPEYYLAAAVAMHDEVYDITSKWADDRYQTVDFLDHYQSPQELVCGLGSAAIIEAEWRRLKLKMRSPDDIRAFLACTEFAALDYVAECIVAQTNKDECEALLNAFCLVRAPEAAAPMLQCKLSSKTPAIARDWLDKHVGNAVAGLIEVAGGRGKLAEAAIDYLRGVKRNGDEPLIASCLKKAGKSEAAAKVKVDVLDHEEKIYPPCDAKSTPKWLEKELSALEKLKPRTLPTWAAAGMLPPLVIGDQRLSDEQLAVVLQLLAAAPITERHPLFGALREHVSATVRDAFAWKLFQLWQEDSFPSKEKWAMGAIGHLGDDGCVLKITPLIRVWPGESQHARAVFGLECLRAIGSSIALMQLSGIAQKLKFKGLKSKAQQFVEEIAKERGMTRDELEDRVVPDCGLDESGRREFSFGPRSFSFVLGGDLKAMVRDEAGKVRSDLPKPGAKDDQDQAGQSLAEWKLLKKQIKEVATIQAGRLEQAMVTGRRWSVADFETLLVRHPLMTHLVQKLIWGGFDAKGKRIATFRATEERDYADPDDNASKLDKVAAVGVVHPLELSDAERARWGEVVSDYELVSPFSQLGRAVYSLEAGEGQTDELKRFHELKLFAPTMVFTLEKLGWTRGEAMDAGCFDEHSKQFPAADVTAVVGYDGTVGMGYIDPDEMLTTKSIHFCSGMRAPSCYAWGSKTKTLKLDKVPPIVVSEVIADLQVLKSKAK